MVFQFTGFVSSAQSFLLDFICFPELESYFNVLAKENPMEVGIIPLVTRGHWLFPSSHTCVALYSPYGEPTFCNEGATQAYHVPLK
jgi:hypothetical protein